MKRYLWDGNEYKEDPDGNVVFYEDAISLLGVEIACNCEIQADLRKTRGSIEYKPISNDWICPAHGYKRL